MLYTQLAKFILDEDGDWIAIYPSHKDYPYALTKDDMANQGILLDKEWKYL